MGVFRFAAKGAYFIVFKLRKQRYPNKSNYLGIFSNTAGKKIPIPNRKALKYSYLRLFWAFFTLRSVEI